MRFSLQDMVRHTLAGAEERVKIAQLQQEPDRDESKKEEKKQALQVYQEIPILITAKSGYHELGQFLAKLENAERFMKVVGMTIKSNKATPKKHDAELLVLTYILTKGK